MVHDLISLPRPQSAHSTRKEPEEDDKTRNAVMIEGIQGELCNCLRQAETPSTVTILKLYWNSWLTLRPCRHTSPEHTV